MILMGVVVLVEGEGALRLFMCVSLGVDVDDVGCGVVRLWIIVQVVEVEFLFDELDDFDLDDLDLEDLVLEDLVLEVDVLDVDVLELLEVVDELSFLVLGVLFVGRVVDECEFVW